MKFFDLFPPPKALNLREASIALSDKALRYITFRRAVGGESRVEKYGEVALPEGVISGGIVNDKEALAKILVNLREEQGFNFVSATLPEEKTYLYTTTLDHLPYKDLADAVAFTLQENVPITLDKSVFSFEIIEVGEKLKTAVSVLPAKTVEVYTEAFELAQITPISFDVESQAVARALIRKGDNRSHLVIELGEGKAGLFLAQNEVVQFSSTIPLEIGNLQTEIKKLLSFWPQGVEQVVVCGVGASDDTLVSKIMADIEKPYVLGNVWTNVMNIEKHLPKMPFDESLRYGAAIGSALAESAHLYV